MAASPAFASGSSAGGAQADASARGRAAYARILVCGSCPYAGGITDPAIAYEALVRVVDGEFDLRPAQSEALMAFIVRRFKLDAGDETEHASGGGR